MKKMFLLFIFILGLDHITKYLAISLKKKAIPIIDPYFKLTYVENRGAAFGIFQNRGLFLTIITILIISYLGYLLITHQQSMKFVTMIGFIMVISGAFGNLIDRMFRGYVIDFIAVSFPGGFEFPVFNIADISVVCGGSMLLIATLFLKEKVLL